MDLLNEALKKKKKYEAFESKLNRYIRRIEDIESRHAVGKLSSDALLKMLAEPATTMRNSEDKIKHQLKQQQTKLQQMYQQLLDISVMVKRRLAQQIHIIQEVKHSE